MSKHGDQYDWIVVGDDPGALLSAGLAAKLGLSVLVLPLLKSRGVLKTKNDKFLDPESNLLLGVGKPDDGGDSGFGLLGRCLEQLGITAAELSAFIAEDALPQVLTPHCRIQAMGSAEKMSQELRREWGDEELKGSGWATALAHSEKGIQKYWSLLPEAYAQAAQSKSFGQAALDRLFPKSARHAGALASVSSRGLKDKAVAGKWFSRERLRNHAHADFFEGLWAGLGGSSFSSPRRFQLLQLAALRAGAVSVSGGNAAFRNLLLKLAKRNGADVELEAECQAVFVSHGKFVGVQPHGHGGMISGSGAMLGVPLLLAAPCVSFNIGTGSPIQLQGRSIPDGWKLTLAISVHPEAIPPGSSRRMVWHEEGAPSIEIELTRGSGYGVRESSSSRCVIMARTVMPMTPESLTSQTQRLTAARMLRKLTETFPFLDYHIEWIYPDFRSDESQEFAEVYGFSSLTAIPSNLLCFGVSGNGIQTGIEGLFVSSGESFPELGSLGYAVSAIEGVNWAARRSQISGPFANGPGPDSRAQTLPG
ncbi:MAG: hypothetical protein P4M08_12570 [Oligoflexia bacterium]|nr:hypothetical protein [Oligoflexia bacterium]